MFPSTYRPWRAVVATGVVCAVIASAAPPGHADVIPPSCPTRHVTAGHLVPALPDILVNAGTPTVTVRGHTAGTCGRAADGSLRLQAAEPVWFQAPTRAALTTRTVAAHRVSVVRAPATGTTDTELTAGVPATGESWVGLRFRLSDAAPSPGLSGLLVTRVVVRTPPTIDPLPAVLPHDNAGARLAGTAWPGDDVLVETPQRRVVCRTFAGADGRWTCQAGAFPYGSTTVTARQQGTGANNPAYPHLASTGLPDQVSDAVTTRVITADPAVLVELSNGTPSVGDVVSYAITATNVGPDTALGVRVDSPLPAGLRYVSSSATAGTYDPATGAWTGIGDLPSMARQRLTIEARVEARGSLSLPATISATGASDGVATSRLHGVDGLADWNLNPANDTTRAELTTAPSADPRLVKRVDRTVSEVGDVVRYTLDATNNGPDTATGVVVHDPLPAGLEFVSADTDVGAFDPRTNRWTIGELSPTATARLVLSTRVVRAGVLTNRATIEASGARHGPASGPAANTDATNDASVAVITVR